MYKDITEELLCEEQEGSRLSIKGFGRIQIISKDGRIKGDSGWNKNAIQMAKGWNSFLGYSLLNSAVASSSSCLVSHMALMTMDTASSLVSTSLSAIQNSSIGLINGVSRISATNNGMIVTSAKSLLTQANGIILRYQGSFNSSNLVTAAPGKGINVLGVFNTTPVSSNINGVFNPIAAVKFNSSTLDSDQIVRCTYEFRFGQ